MLNNREMDITGYANRGESAGGAANTGNTGKPLDLSNLKGTRDYLPEAQRIRARVIRTLEDTFALYGYPPLETPMLNRFDVLASKYAGGAEILKEMYRLQDQGGRELALRYDLTVPFAKVMGLNPDRPLPFRRYEIGRVFRDGPVKTGRNREFTQCDVDVVGISSVLAEAEMMEMAVRIYKTLGLDIVIRYNNRKWLQAVVEAAGIPSDKVLPVLSAVDKLEKIGREGVCGELTQRGITRDQQERFFSLLRMGRQALREASAELDALESALEALGVAARTVFTPTLTRGLDLSGRRLRQAMRDAARRKAPYVVLVGEDELAQGRVIVREMGTELGTGRETAVPLEAVGTWLGMARAQKTTTSADA